MTTDDIVQNETDFAKLFSPFIDKNEDGTYSFEESPLGLWVSFKSDVRGEWITISGWKGPDLANPILEKTFDLPLSVSELLHLFYAREDASRIICREKRDRLNDPVLYPGVVWEDDQVIWRKVWHKMLDEGLDHEERLAFFKGDYKK